MPTPSGVPTIDPVYVESLIVVVRNPDGEMVVPSIYTDPTPPADTSTRVFVFSS